LFKKSYNTQVISNNKYYSITLSAALTEDTILLGTTGTSCKYSC